MRLQIDIEDGAGVKQGSGPITTATGWQQTRRLDRAGTFSFAMPAQDPQRALCAAKRVARCWGLTEGNAPLELGAGIIDSRSLRVGAGGASAAIAGDDLLRELTDRSVGLLTIADVSTRAPDQIKYNNDPTGANTFADQTPSFALTISTDDFVYIGDADPFEEIAFDLGGTVNAVPATMALAYWDGSVWQDIDIVDGTATQGKTLRQDGSVTFERLLDWTTCTVDGDSAYWVRLNSSHDLTSTLSFMAITLTHVLPTFSAPYKIMALAPITWALGDLSGFGKTQTAVYGRFGGESVLSALCKVAEATGEHFVLTPGERTVYWNNHNFVDCGLRAVAHVDPLAAAGNPDIVLLADLQLAQDSYDLCTRLYPFGGGNSANRITLGNADWSPPAGYTIDQDANGLWYIESDAGIAAYGQIDRTVAFADIAAQRNTVADLRMAANQLALAAYNWLARADAPHEAYTCRVVKAPPAAVIVPGGTIKVEYHEWRDGAHVIDVDETLYILEVTEEVDGDGIRAVGLALANVDAWPVGDADLGVSALEEGRVIETYAQGTMAYTTSGPYVRRIDATHDAVFTCKIGPEVTDLQRATLRFKTAPLTSSVVSSTGAAEEEDVETTDSTTWTSSTSSSYTTHSHTVEVFNETGGADVTLKVVAGSSRYLAANGDSGYLATNAAGSHAHTVDGTAHDHTITIPAHSHSTTITYGIYTDDGTPNPPGHDFYPSGLSVELDGADITTALGGPWADDPEAIEIEADITTQMLAAAGGLRQRHRLVISATGGQGEIECEVTAFVVVQAIVVA
jgi:hypothetical protein